MKRLLLSSFTVGFCNLVLAQTFTPEVGLSYMIQPNSFYDIKSAGFTYSPRLNIREYKNSSLSVGLPMTLAFSNFKWLQFTSVDFPIELDYNIGAGSKKEIKRNSAFSLGAVTVFMSAMFASTRLIVRITIFHFPVCQQVSSATILLLYPAGIQSASLGPR